MAATTAASIPLVFEEKLVAPSYNWFGELDYGWFDNSGSLSSIPFFETASEQLAALLETSGRHELRLGFGPRDCTTASGSRNCTEACSDPTSLWTPTNFRVCTALAATALLVQNGTYSIDQTGGRAAQITETWSIPSLSTYNATGVFRHVAECLPESCILPALGDCTDTVRSLPSMDINADNLGTISSVLGHYCDGARAGINADIAGPGVILSYIFQTSLAVLLFCLLKVSTTWIRLLRVFSRKSQGKLEELQNRLWDSRLRAAATSSLVEFQEVQIYFTAAVQIATLASFDPDEDDNIGANNSSYAAVILNSGLAALLNITAMAGILLVQCCLQRAHMHWWYTFFLMTLNCIMAAIIFARRSSLMPPADLLWEEFRADAPLPLCGNNPSPMTFCRPSRDTRFLDNNITGWIACGLGSIAWIGLLVDQLASTVPNKFPAVLTRMRNLDRRGILQRKKLWGMMTTVYWLVEPLLLFMALFHFSVLGLIVEDIQFGTAGSWSFGQIIAVTVWAPTIAKFIYFNVFGVKEGFEERIANDYQITRMQDDESVERHGSLSPQG